MLRQPHPDQPPCPSTARALLRPFHPFSTPFRAFFQIRVALAQIQTPIEKKTIEINWSIKRRTPSSPERRRRSPAC